MTNTCPTCNQRALEQALRDRDLQRLGEIMNEMNRASVAQFRRDTIRPVEPLIQRQA